MSRKPAASLDPDALMDTKLTCGFFGGKSKMTIHRWVRDRVPQPMQIAGQNYWVRRELLAFRDAQREKSERTRAPVGQTGVPMAQRADSSEATEATASMRTAGAT